MDDEKVKISITGPFGDTYQQEGNENVPHENFQCSSICDLDDSENSQNSYLLVSEDYNDSTFGNQKVSRKLSFRQLSASILSDQVNNADGLAQSILTISTALSSIIIDNGKTLSVRTTESPYIISSIYEKHGEILSVDGYSLSNQISVTPIISVGTDIAKIKIGNQTNIIKIPNQAEPASTEITTYDSSLSTIQSKTTRTILKIHVMSDDSYDILSGNTSTVIVNGRPVFQADDENSPYVHSNELYLTTEDEWEQDPPVVGFFLATEHLGGETQEEDDIQDASNPGSMLMGQTQEETTQTDDTQQSQDQEDDESSEMVGYDIRDFDEVTFLDILSKDIEETPEENPESNETQGTDSQTSEGD